MRADLGHAHGDKDRGAGGGHDAVVSGGRHAHAEDDAADHREEHRNELGVHEGDLIADGHDGADELGGKAGGGDAAGDDARHAAGDGDGDGALAAGFESLEYLGGGDAVILIEKAHDDGDEDRDGRGELHRAGVGGDEPYEHDQREQQVYLPEELTHNRQLFLGDTAQVELLCLEVNCYEYAGEVQHSREDGAQRDLTVGDVHVLCHQERGSAHDRRHYLAAGGGCGLDSACKLRLVAGLLHHRDRDGTGGDSVADRGAGDHAAQSGGNDRDLSRAAGEAADEGVCEVDKESRDAGALKERAEDDEHNDVLCADLDRRTHDAAGGVEQGIEHALERGADGKGVDDQHGGDAEDRHADAAAAQFHQAEDADDADGDLERRDLRRTGQNHDERVIGEAVIEKARRADDHKHIVKPRNVVVADMVLRCGVGHVAHDDDAADERGEALFDGRDAEERRPDAVQRENDHDDTDDYSRSTLPCARIGFAVVLTHDGFNIRSRAYVDLNIYAGIDDFVCRSDVKMILAWHYVCPFPFNI